MERGTRGRDKAVWELRIVEAHLVLFQIHDQLCGPGWQDPLECMRARCV